MVHKSKIPWQEIRMKVSGGFMFFKRRFLGIYLAVLFAGLCNSMYATSISDPITCIETLEKALVVSSGSGQDVLNSDNQEIRDLVVQAQLVQQVLFDIIAHIDDALRYWQAQRYHPNWYLFNKGPRGWFNKVWYGSNPSDEIAMNIATLESYDNHYCELLGKVTQVLDKVPNVLLNQKEIIKPEKYSWISLYKRAALDTFVTLQKPTHFQRHWMKYATAGVGLVLAGGYVYANKDKLIQMFNDVQAGIQKRYDENLAKPIKDFKDLIFNKNVQEALEPLPVLDTKSVRDKLFKQFIEFDNAQKSQVVKIFETISKNLSIESTQKQAIKQALEGGDVIQAADLLGAIDAKNREILSKEFGIFSALTSRNELNTAIVNTVQTGMMHKVDLSTFFITSWLKQFVGLILFDTWTPLEGSLQIMHSDIERVRKEFLEIKASQRMNLILSTLIPTLVAAGVGGYGLKKIFSLFKGKAKDFQPLRETLADISTLLNRYNNPSSPVITQADSGRLAYLHVKAARQARSLLAEQDLDHILADIQEFSRPEFSMSQRLHVLDDMYKKYRFLQHQVKAA